MSCGIGCKHGSDPALLWLWHSLGTSICCRHSPKKKKKKKNHTLCKFCELNQNFQNDATFKDNMIYPKRHKPEDSILPLTRGKLV